jgi:hypothetical protein
MKSALSLALIVCWVRSALPAAGEEPVPCPIAAASTREAARLATTREPLPSSIETATSTMRRVGSNRSRTRSSRKCYLYFRYELLPVCPEWTLKKWLLRLDSNQQPSG